MKFKKKSEKYNNFLAIYSILLRIGILEKGLKNHKNIFYSGTNKSAAMQSVVELIEGLPGDQIYESGTLDGLMKLLGENNETTMGSYDELATFVDSLDKGM